MVLIRNKAIGILRHLTIDDHDESSSFLHRNLSLIEWWTGWLASARLKGATTPTLHTAGSPLSHFSLAVQAPRPPRKSPPSMQRDARTGEKLFST